MLPLRSATAIIALITVAVSAIAIFAGLDYFVAMGGFIPARLSAPSSAASSHAMAVTMVIVMVAVRGRRISASRPR